MFRFLQAEIVGWVHGSLDGVGDANKHPDLLDKARLLGEKQTA
jgi:hypothetical protein